jgi:hypothetical protein
MLCRSCDSGKTREFSAEVSIHFPGMKGRDLPCVWLFPRLRVCLKCGAAQFTIPDNELKQLAKEDYREAAA